MEHDMSLLNFFLILSVIFIIIEIVGIIYYNKKRRDKGISIEGFEQPIKVGTDIMIIMILVALLMGIFFTVIIFKMK